VQPPVYLLQPTFKAEQTVVEDLYLAVGVIETVLDLAGEFCDADFKIVLLNGERVLLGCDLNLIGKQRVLLGGKLVLLGGKVVLLLGNCRKGGPQLGHLRAELSLSFQQRFKHRACCNFFGHLTIIFSTKRPKAQRQKLSEP